jgi:uncharacterized membrane-anchored protein
MARKRRKDEKEEEYEWVPPEFDETAFLKKDIVGTKALMYTSIIAIVFGIAAALVGAASSYYIGFVVYIVGGVLLNYFYKFLGIKVEDIDRKGLIGNIALYFLLALGVWILLMNAPFNILG